MKTGETHDHALHYTIERRQPERKGKANPQFAPPLPLGDYGSPERVLSFAQRLYADALNDKSSTLPSRNLPVLPPIKHTSSSALPTSGRSRAPSGVSCRKTSPSTLLFDTSSEVSQSFNPSDLYHTSVATHGFPSWGSTSPEMGATRPQSLLPVLQIPNSLPVACLSDPANSLAPPPSQNPIPRSGGQNPRSVLHQPQNVSIRPRSCSTLVLSIHEASGLQGVSVESHQDRHPPAAAGGAIASPLQQQLVPNSLLQPPPEINHEEVPLYSLVDEQLPPPAFDDLRTTSATEAPDERSPVVHNQTLPQEVIEAPSSQSMLPSHSLPPFSHGSTTHVPGKPPVYALLDQTSHPVSTGKHILRDAKIPLSSITTWRPSDSSSSGPPSVVPIDFKWSDQLPSMSPLLPSSAVFHDRLSTTSILPLTSHPLSVSSSRTSDSQSTRSSCDPPATRKSTTSSPPPVNYHTKPTTKRSGRFLPSLALQRYAFRFIEFNLRLTVP